MGWYENMTIPDWHPQVADDAQVICAPAPVQLSGVRRQRELLVWTSVSVGWHVLLYRSGGKKNQMTRYNVTYLYCAKCQQPLSTSKQYLEKSLVSSH